MNRTHLPTSCSALALLISLAAPAGAQDGAWDSPRVLRMVEDARVRRALPYEDSALRNYSARAQGHIYFYLDREEADELTLVKVDQVALEVYWAYPGATRQRIVGLRDESVLPNRMRYHLDHLTVVQNEFGDRIHLGDGDEVQSVVHPIAPGSERIYNFRLADSLTLRLGGLPEPLRVYEIDVRPRDPSSPGFVGSVFVDAAGADIVRMDFTFTRSSYVDRRLDYIRISLENGLWQGRFWLPYEQQVELRRQVPELDFPAGAVIRGRMQVRDYEFNVPLSPLLFRGPTVTSVPRAEREAYAFEDELFADLAEEGLAPDPDLEALQREAAELIGRRYLAGLPALRLDLRGSSNVLRFNRTERLHLGAGLSYRPGGGSTTLRTGLGYSFGTEEPSARAGLETRLRGRELGLEAWWNQPRDLGYQATAGVINTLSSLAAAAGAGFGHDFQDTWFSRGASVSVRQSFGGIRAGLTGFYDDQRSPHQLVDGYAPDPGDELDRPLAVVQPGTFAGAAVRLERRAVPEAARGWNGSVRIDYTTPVEADATVGTHGGLDVDVTWRTSSVDRDWHANARVRAGATMGDAPIQRAYLLGGAGTVPGYEFRSFAGDRSVLLQTELRRRIRHPWLSARISGATGWVDRSDHRFDVLRPDALIGSVGPSIGLGVGIVNDILWLDVWRGLDGGDWEVLLTADPRLWDIL